MKKSVKEIFNSIKEMQIDDGESVYEIKDFIPYFCKKVDEELDYAEKCHSLEAELGSSLEEVINLLFEGLKLAGLYQCITCTNVMHNEMGCDGSCEHNKEFSKKEILKILKKYVDYHKELREGKSK